MLMYDPLKQRIPMKRDEANDRRECNSRHDVTSSQTSRADTNRTDVLSIHRKNGHSRSGRSNSRAATMEMQPAACQTLGQGGLIS